VLPPNEENQNGAELRREVVSAVKDEEGEIAYHCEAGDDSPVIPGLGLTTPLEGEEEGNDGTEREDRAEPIERLPLLPVGHALVHGRLDWIMSREPDGDGGDRNGTKGKVDVEAPAPGSVVCECATEERADDAGKGEDTTEATEESGPVFEASYLADDSEDRDEDARGTDTLYRATEDEDVDAGTDTADETAELEDADRDQVEVFSFCNGEELAKGEHEACLGD